MNVKLIGKHEKDSRACRDGLALTLDEMMAQDKSICYVDCDLMGCINTKRLREHYPDRAFEAGIAEGNAAGVSAGLAATGKKVFFHSFGTFSSRRCYDQIYMSAAYAGLTVHVLGSDAGVTAAFNGGTHMPLEDAAMYLSIPETTVLDPADYDQLASITRQLVNIDKGVTYTRFVRKGIIQVYGEGSEFEIGKGVVLHESDKDQATIRACPAASCWTPARARAPLSLSPSTTTPPSPMRSSGPRRWPPRKRLWKTPRTLEEGESNERETDR